MAGEEEKFPTDLEGLGYHFNAEGQLRTIEGDKPFEFSVRDGDHLYNQRHYNALGEVITERVYTMMEQQYKLQRTYLPINAEEGEPKSFLFISGDLYTNQDKLLILIHGNGVVRAGQWARRLIINDRLESGTQLPYIKWGRENGYAIIVANPNLNTVEPDNKRKKQPIKIKGNGTPEEHTESMWRDFVQRAPARHVAIVAHSYGGVSTLELAKKYLREFEERVFAVALTDSVHGLRHQEANEDVVGYYKKNVVNWASAYDSLDTQLQTMEDEVPTVSAGTDKHENTSYSSMDSIFKYFDERFKALKDPTRKRWIVGEGKLPIIPPVNAKARDLKKVEEIEVGVEQTEQTSSNQNAGDQGEATNQNAGDTGESANENAGDKGEATNQNAGGNGESANENTGDKVESANENAGDKGESESTNQNGELTNEKERQTNDDSKDTESGIEADNSQTNEYVKNEL